MTLDNFKFMYPQSYEARLIVYITQQYSIMEIAVNTLINQNEYGRELAKKAYSRLIKKQSKYFQ